MALNHAFFGQMCIFFLTRVKTSSIPIDGECSVMLRVCLVSASNTGLLLTIKKIIVFLLRKVLLPACLVLLLAGVCSMCFPMKAEAGAKLENHTKTAGLVQPLYLQQLEKYSVEAEKYKEDQARLKREETLKKALLQHTVHPGETLTHIARSYRVDLEALICWNRINDPNLIFPGQVLDLLAIPGAMHIVCEGDTIKSIAGRYQSSSQVITAFNLLEGTPLLVPGQKLVIPGGVLPTLERKAAQATLIASRFGLRGSLPPCPSFDWPVKGRLSSLYGWRKGDFHYGLDIAIPHGSTIQAAAAGTVLETGTKQGYGLTLVIEHANEWRTLYAHCSRLLVKEDEKVSRGQPVALIGATGNATGPHLHWEVIHGEQRFDPLTFLPGSGN